MTPAELRALYLAAAAAARLHAVPVDALWQPARGRHAGRRESTKAMRAMRARARRARRHAVYAAHIFLSLSQPTIAPVFGVSRQAVGRLVRDTEDRRDDCPTESRQVAELAVLLRLDGVLV